MQAPKKRRQEPESSSESDDELISTGELEKFKKEALFWRQQFELEQQHTASLRERIKFLEGKVGSQLSSGEFLCPFFNRGFVVVWMCIDTDLLSFFLVHQLLQSVAVSVDGKKILKYWLFQTGVS